MLSPLFLLPRRAVRHGEVIGEQGLVYWPTSLKRGSAPRRGADIPQSLAVFSENRKSLLVSHKFANHYDAHAGSKAILVLFKISVLLSEICRLKCVYSVVWFFRLGA